MIENDLINSIINKFKYEKNFSDFNNTKSFLYILDKQQCNTFQKGL